MASSFLQQTSRVALAAAGGLLAFCSFEPLGWWWAGILGIACLYLALRPGGARVAPASAALIGFAHGAVLYLLLLPWVGEFVGAMPYLALAIYLSLWSLAFGLVMAPLLRRFGPAVFVAVFCLFELMRSSFPFGGFAWVRMAWGQIDGPLAQLASWGGPGLVTITATTCAVALVEWVSWASKSKEARWKHPGAITLACCLLASGLAWLTNGTAEPVGEVKVAAIQGNVPRMGLDFNAQRRAVLANHVNETKKLNGDVDLIIWPENSADVSPFVDKEAAKLVDDALASAQAPILVGTITRDDVGMRNTMVVMDPKTGRGEQHDKRFLQPFGEYMPMRDFFRRFSPLVDLAGDFKPGNGDGVVHMRASFGTVVVGVATCYEVAFDQAYRSAVAAGAQILTTPTNNATFGFTDMTYQQLAMSRMRAIEFDRAVVVAATSGVSAIVRPNGEVSSYTEIFEPGTLRATLPLKDSRTIASRVGSLPEYAVAAAGLLFILVGLAGSGFASRFPRRIGRALRSDAKKPVEGE